MSGNLTDEEVYRIARQRVEEKKGFYTHLIVYICVNILLVLIWFFTGHGFPWFIFPLGGWGIGLLFHFLGVFVLSQGGSAWEKREIEKEIEKIKKTQS
jgi:hypothetical protein